MNATHVRTEAATNTRNGFTGDFVDFVIAFYLDGEQAMTAEGQKAQGWELGVSLGFCEQITGWRKVKLALRREMQG